ncbi:hypothetical protein [Cytobacillus oceanisediminis]|uniref:hypothetical protein n=1 Tax=Cytobacillus oceanisediminis TaxID=665099 RepID=UPI001C22E237|nr:hypothetical protein [Cytobacillus oceanisediminis]MBU8768888.1 hypothetical protein [Cytobacillus oceanisediminis]
MSPNLGDLRTEEEETGGRESELGDLRTEEEEAGGYESELGRPSDRRGRNRRV